LKENERTRFCRPGILVAGGGGRGGTEKLIRCHCIHKGGAPPKPGGLPGNSKNRGITWRQTTKTQQKRKGGGKENNTGCWASKTAVLSGQKREAAKGPALQNFWSRAKFPNTFYVMGQGQGPTGTKPRIAKPSSRKTLCRPAGKGISLQTGQNGTETTGRGRGRRAKGRQGITKGCCRVGTQNQRNKTARPKEKAIVHVLCGMTRIRGTVKNPPDFAKRTRNQAVYCGC